jgi:hypothetical protein
MKAMGGPGGMGDMMKGLGGNPFGGGKGGKFPF